MERAFRLESDNDLILVEGLINHIIDDVNKLDCPYFYGFVHSTPESRNGVLKDIKKLMRGGINISGAIGRIERMYNPNMIEDM